MIQKRGLFERYKEEHQDVVASDLVEGDSSSSFLDNSSQSPRPEKRAILERV